MESVKSQKDGIKDGWAKTQPFSFLGVAKLNLIYDDRHAFPQVHDESAQDDNAALHADHSHDADDMAESRSESDV